MRTISCILTILTALLISISATAEKPRWASNGTASLEKERTNESYTFKNFETFNADINQLRSERFNPLVGYLANTYGLDSTSAKVELISGDSAFASAPNDADGDTRVQAEYKVTFSSPGRAASNQRSTTSTLHAAITPRLSRYP